jgi:hypothetical protein
VTPVTPVEPAAPVNPAAEVNSYVVPSVETPSVQVLFLGEEALIDSASGSLSGSLLLCMVLIALTISAAAFLHSKEAFHKPLYQGHLLHKKSNRVVESENNMLGEYLLIKE